MLLVKPRLIASPGKLSLRAIVRGQTKASLCPELALYLYLVNILYICVFFGVRLGALNELGGLGSKAFERMSKGQSPRA
jgi:hypothetical protein